MLERELMERAIAEAAKCNWPAEEEESKPRVGAVITIDGEPTASAHRGEDDHAEKLALSQIPFEQDLSKATVWTTLEPCTHTVRRKQGESCTERLIRARVEKVVIGILDPNQGVCGKGLLKLQESGIEVALFPHDLALRIRRMNDKFIQAQQTLGITITSPRDGDVLPVGDHKFKGIFINPPGRDVIAMTDVDPLQSVGLGGWWPQGPLKIVPGADNESEVTVQFGVALPHKICIVKANELGIELINFYDRLKDIRDRVIVTVANLYCRDLEHVLSKVAPSHWPLPMSSSLPKGLDLQDSVNIEVVNPRGA